MCSSTLISLAALLVAAASYWHSSLRPAKVALDRLSEHVSGGGINNFPVVTRLEIELSLVNLGARAGLIRSIKVANVRAAGAPAFATYAIGGAHSANENSPSVSFDGEPGRFPQTIEAGDVRGITIGLRLQGSFLGEEGSSYLYGEDQQREVKARAEELAQLEEVSFDVVCEYRRGGGFWGRTDDETKTTITIPGEWFKEPAARFWRGEANRPDLADLLGTPPGGD
jgi:hypothetical protein